MAATKSLLFVFGLLALLAVASAHSDEESVVASAVVPSGGSRALLTGKLFNFDFHSYGHKKYMVYKKYYEDDEDDHEDEDDDCDDEDNHDCGDKKYYRVCYYRHNNKKCDCKKEHKKVYYVVKYKKSSCHK